MSTVSCYGVCWKEQAVKNSFFVWDSLTLTEEKFNLSIVSWGALLVPLLDWERIVSVCACGKGLIVFLFFWIRSITRGDRNPDSSRRSADCLSGDRAGRWSSPSKTVHYITFPKSLMSTASSPLWALSEGQLKPFTSFSREDWPQRDLTICLHACQARGDAYLAKQWIRAYHV